jgi:hypothetical protein
MCNICFKKNKICATFWILSILQVWLCQHSVNGSGELIVDKIRPLQVFTSYLSCYVNISSCLEYAMVNNLNHQALTANSKVAVNHLWHHMISKPAFTFVAYKQNLAKQLFAFVRYKHIYKTMIHHRTTSEPKEYCSICIWRDLHKSMDQSYIFLWECNENFCPSDF